MNKSKQLLSLVSEEFKLSLHNVRKLIAKSMKAVGAPKHWADNMADLSADYSWSSAFNDPIADIDSEIKKDKKDPEGIWEDDIELFHDPIIHFVDSIDRAKGGFKEEHVELLKKILHHLAWENNPYSKKV